MTGERSGAVNDTAHEHATRQARWTDLAGRNLARANLSGDDLDQADLHEVAFPWAGSRAPTWRMRISLMPT